MYVKEQVSKPRGEGQWGLLACLDSITCLADPLSEHTKVLSNWPLLVNKVYDWVKK